MFTHTNIISTAQFTDDDISVLFDRAREMRTLVKSKGSSDMLKGKLMTALFYEPSSRTFGSFIAAMQRLGGMIIPLQGVTYSSVAKGETLTDTIATFSGYSDVIVLRHPQVGAATLAAQVTKVPIINAGDGPGEHPTQALLDLFTIIDHTKTINGKVITFVGDLLNGRTVHSLLTLVLLYKPKEIRLISPEELRLDEKSTATLANASIRYTEHDSLDWALEDTDVLYVTRIQKERFHDLNVYEKLKDQFIIRSHTMDLLQKSAIVLHPFPRISEIHPEIDSDPRSLYLTKQIPNGMYIRMALLSLILKHR
jgi:aspartate carbamoyltransferase